VFRDFKINAESTAGLPYTSKGEIEKIYGEINTTNLYGGVCDGQLCFEHTINIFQGCTGTIIFLLDKNQDPAKGVTKEDYGKAIAINVGGDDAGDGLVRNFAFKILL